MEHGTHILPASMLPYLCNKVGDRWEFNDNMREGWIDGKPPVFINDCYWPFIDTDYPESHKRQQHLMGGSGSGKSRFLATKFLLKAQNKDYFRLLYVRQTKESIKKSTYQLFIDIINEYGWNRKFKPNKTTFDILCVDTQNVMFSAGLDDVSKLQSIADPTDIWIEEPISQNTNNNVSFKAYTELLRRLRTPLAELHLHSSYNPINKASFYYTKFVKTKVYPSDQVAILNTTYLDNPFLPEAYKAELENLINVNEDEANVFAFGRWGDSESKHRWVRTFKPARHVKNTTKSIEALKDVAFIPGEPVDLIYDFNVVPYMPMAASQSLFRNKWVRDYKTGLQVFKQVLQVRYFREYALSNPFNSAEHVTNRFITDYIEPYGKVPVDYYGDATGDYGVPGLGSRDVASRYIPIVNVLKQNDLWHNDSKKVLKGNPYLVDQRELVEDILAGKYDIEVVIDELNCPNFVEDLSSLQEGAKGFDKARDKNGVEHRGHFFSILSSHLCSKFKYLLKQRGTTGNESETE